MKKKMSSNSINNLKIFKKGEYTETQRKGTMASIESRGTIKEIREWAKDNLFSERGESKTPLYELLFKKLEQLSITGNIRAIEMLLNYSGLKPIEQIAEVDTDGNDKKNITFNIVGIKNKEEAEEEQEQEE